MKTLNIFRKVFFVIGAALVAVAAVLHGVISDSAMTAVAVATGVSVVCVTVLALILGLVLDFSKNEVAHKVGIGLHVSAVVILVTYALAWFMVLPGNENNPGGWIECFVIFGGAALYGFGWFMTLLMHASRRYDGVACGCKAIQPEEDAHIAAIMKWKKLYNEGIITEREFIDKRNEILGLRK